MDFESILEEILWVEDKETLNLSRNRKKGYRRLFLNGRDCLLLINKRVPFSSHDLVQSVVSQTVN